MRIAGQTVVTLFEETVRVVIIVVTGCPTRAVAIGTAYLSEEFLSFQYLFVGHVAGGGDCQTAVPDHEIDEILVAHLYIQFLGSQISGDGFRHLSLVGIIGSMPGGVILGGVERFDVCLVTGLYIRVVGRSLDV